MIVRGTLRNLLNLRHGLLTSTVEQQTSFHLVISINHLSQHKIPTFCLLIKRYQGTKVAGAAFISSSMESKCLLVEAQLWANRT